MTAVHALTPSPFAYSPLTYTRSHSFTTHQRSGATRMAYLFGREYTKAELLHYVGDISQIARAKAHRLIEGHEDGVLGIDVTTGSGFDFTVLPSRGMDISSASYKG